MGDILDASFDSGADHSVVPPKTLTKFRDQRRDVIVHKLASPIMVKGFVGPPYRVTEEAVLDLCFETDGGPLTLMNVKCWVSGGGLPSSVDDILLSRAIMYKLGYDPRSMLREAAAMADEYDMSEAISYSGVVKAVMMASHELVDDLATEEEALLSMDEVAVGQ
ncbi:hypothetical protein B5M09_011258 [Aphanomyces astaci]|uniref:Peptidase A2 domain-containing protein n=1 Tax=Aphanomyces astaci TaxID=112090 RepID=A0A425C5Q7_APHAT|nr:hypothetical protein B5M09_011258 [Aphanomyces astaci]